MLDLLYTLNDSLSSKTPLEVNLLNDTVKNTVNNYRTVHHMEKENKQLNQKVRSLEDREVGAEEKQFVFLDGAKWMRKYDYQGYHSYLAI